MLPAMKKPLTLAEFASLGGLARAKKLSAARRSEIARNAGKAKGKAGKAKKAGKK